MVFLWCRHNLSSSTKPTTSSKDTLPTVWINISLLKWPKLLVLCERIGGVCRIFAVTNVYLLRGLWRYVVKCFNVALISACVQSDVLFCLPISSCHKKNMLAKLENTIILLVGPPKFCIRIVFSFSWDLQWFQEKTQTTLIQNLGGQTEYYGVFRFNQLEIYVSLSLKPTASNFTMKIPTLLAKKTWPRHSYSVCILIISGWLEKYMYKPNCVEHVSR